MHPSSQESICQMFDRIALSYDSVNRLLSFRQDIRWRRSVAQMIADDGSIDVLDIATGTAELPIEMCRINPSIKGIMGIDLSESMLAIARDKVMARALDQRISLRVADACSLPFEDEAFDVVSIAFGIRNVTEMSKALAESYRVLKENGIFLILEFSLPKQPVVRSGYLFYFRHVLPLLGGALSGSYKAYRYLNRTVEAFLDPVSFRDVLLNRGFRSVDVLPQSCGIATIYRARK